MDRMKKFKKRFEMYGDNYHDQVENKLGLMYKAMKELKLDIQINDHNNLYKQVINTISNVYSFGVNREFSDNNVQELYDNIRVDKTMTQANRYVNAFNDVILQVSWDFNKDVPTLLLRLPHTTKVDYMAGDVVSVEYFVEYVGEDEKTERWAYWSKTEHYYIDKTKGLETKVAIKDNDEMVNPLGILPFIFMHNGWRDASFWDTYTGDDLTGGTVDLAIHLTFLNHIIKTQSFKQLVGKGDNIKELKGQMLDPLTILTLTGNNTEIDVLDLQANYDSLNKVIQDLANNIAVNYNVSPAQFRMTSQVSSGFALQMENLKLDRFTVEQQQDFKVYEKELFNLIQVISAVYENPKALGTISVDFVEPTHPTSRKEQVEIDRERIDLGLTSSVDILMRDNPDLTEEEATKIVDDNLEARNNMLDKINTTETLDEFARAIQPTD